MTLDDDLFMDLSRRDLHTLGRIAGEGACRSADPTLFFHQRHQTAVNSAREVCRSCPVMDECADYAIRNERFGMWGALTEMERMKLRDKMEVLV